jgi:polyhydroxybutyrate depolymerase
VSFISDLIDTVKNSFQINSRRVYACGMSNGGIMSLYLACQLPNKITAVASVAGTMFSGWFNCLPGRPCPIMMVNGTNDQTVPYNGTGSFMPVDTVLQKWILYNQTTATFSTTLADLNFTDNSHVEYFSYSSGSSGSEVVLFKVIYGEHAWPGAVSVLPGTNQDISASAEIWKFFRQFKLQQFVPTVGVTEHHISCSPSPNPVAEVLKFKGCTFSEVRLFDQSGRMLLKSENSELDVSEVSPGLYVVCATTGAGVICWKILKL